MSMKNTSVKAAWTQLFTTVHTEDGWITAVLPSIEGVEAPEAFWRPAEGIPSIAEVLLHVDGWLATIVRGIRGEPGGENEDWPAAPEGTVANWVALRERVASRIAEANSVLEALDVEALYENRPGDVGTRAAALGDIFAHNAYHAGQIVRTRQLYAAFQAKELVLA